MLADGKRDGSDGGNLLAHLSPDLLELLEPDQLEMLNRLYGGSGTSCNSSNDQEMKEEIRSILVQSALMLHAILDKFGLKPSNLGSVSGKKNNLEIDAQNVEKMCINDLFFVACNGGEMFAQLCIEADQLAVDEFISALCNYATMTELPQLIVPSIVLRFNEPFNKQLPNLTDLNNMFKCIKNDGKCMEYMATNQSTVPSTKCMVNIQYGAKCGSTHRKLANFQLKMGL